MNESTKPKCSNSKETYELEKKKICTNGVRKEFSLALSGGGIRSASVTRGFLNHLEKNGHTKKISYISSVSGGSYAASEFTFNQSLADRTHNPKEVKYKLRDMVFSCFTSIIRRLLMPIFFGFVVLLIFDYLNLSPSQCISAKDVKKCSQLLSNRYSSLASFCVFIPALFIAALRNKLSPNTLASMLKFILTVGMLIGISALFVTMKYTIIYVFFALFIVTSFIHSKKPHRKTDYAIYHGLDVALMNSLISIGVFYFTETANSNAKGWALLTIFLIILYLTLWSLYKLISSRKLPSFSLFKYYETLLKETFIARNRKTLLSESEFKIPFLIINSTAYQDGIKSHCEITPLHILYSSKDGSSKYLEHKNQITLSQAIAASGAAINYNNLPWGLNAISSLLPNLGAKIWIKNDATVSRTPSRNIFINNKSVLVELCDGGFTDNLGLLALFKREEKNIICLDAAYDEKYSFNDLKNTINYAIANDLINDADISNLCKFKQELRFSTNKTEVTQITIEYQNGKCGVILYAKLNARKSTLRRKYLDFPHIPTSDQQLKIEEIQELIKIGEHLGNEAMRKFKELAKQTHLNRDAAVTPS